MAAWLPDTACMVFEFAHQFAVAAAWPFQLFGAAGRWYLAMQGLAALALPLVFGICTRLTDRGWALSKVVGLVLATWIAWMIAFFPPGSPLGLGFTPGGVAAAVGALALIGAVGAARNARDLVAFVRRRWRIVVLIEVVFALAFVAMLLLRAARPQITHVIADSAAEKFTDFAVLNGLLTSTFFPPHDAWVAGEHLNYYYFGHFLWAFLIKLTMYAPEVGFNLALASIFSLACALSLSLGINATGRARWGLLTMFLVALASNMDGTLHLVGLIKERMIDGTGPQPWYMGYNFWRSSRAVENTITEFPAFSFLLGDLHAHLSSLILMLALLTVALQVWRGVGAHRSLLRYEMEAGGDLLLGALLIGAMSAANSWDVVVGSAALAAAVWAGRRGNSRCQPDAGAGGAFYAAAGWRFVQGLEAALFAGVVALAGVGVLFFQFRRHFVPPFDGFPLAWVDPFNRTLPAEFVCHWGMLAAAPVVLVTWLAWRAARRAVAGGAHSGEIPGALVMVGAATAFVLVPIFQGWVAALAAVAVAALFLALCAASLPPAIRLILGFLLVFAAGALGCELVFLDDLFADATERINTVFKVYYGLWPLMALATTMALHRLSRYAPAPAARRGRALWWVAALLVLGAAYPVAGTLQRIGASSEPPPPQTALEALDGLRQYAQSNPGDYDTAMWIRANLPPDAVILEMPGTQYVYEGRIATWTGRPAMLGWGFHSGAWRPAEWAKRERNRRFDEATTVYTTRDPAVAWGILNRNRVGYVVVGDAEREKVLDVDGGTFAQWGDKVFDCRGTAVWKVRDAGPPPPAAKETSEPARTTVEIPEAPPRDDRGQSVQTNGGTGAPATDRKPDGAQEAKDTPSAELDEEPEMPAGKEAAATPSRLTPSQEVLDLLLKSPARGETTATVRR